MLGCTFRCTQKFYNVCIYVCTDYDAQEFNCTVCIYVQATAASGAPSAKRSRSASEDVDVEAEARKGNVCFITTSTQCFLFSYCSF